MDAATSSGDSTFSAEQFFATQEPPPKLAHVLEAVQTFVTGHARAGRRVVLVTVREVRTSPVVDADFAPRCCFGLCRAVERLSRLSTMCETPSLIDGSVHARLQLQQD